MNWFSLIFFRSEKEVFPRFVTGFPGQGIYSLDERIIQPTQVKIFANQIFVFTTPQQNDEDIQSIYNDGQRIYLEVSILGSHPKYPNFPSNLLQAFRPKDKSSSEKKIEFQICTHQSLLNNNGVIDWCSFCLEHPDLLGQTLLGSLKKLETRGGVINTEYLISHYYRVSQKNV